MDSEENDVEKKITPVETMVEVHGQIGGIGVQFYISLL